MIQSVKVDVVAAVNDERVLTENLALSPLFREQISLWPMRAYSSAGEAYNAGLDAGHSDVLVFAHQDVYLPQPWLQQLFTGMQAVEAIDPDWAVIGVYGVGREGKHVGHCWSSGLNRELGFEFGPPQRVVSIDELVIILRRSSGLRFDEGLPGFHLYGTDIVQAALAKGFGAYVIHAPVVHNSRRVKTLFGAYARAYRYMQRKWRNTLPIQTTVVPVTKFGYPLFRAALRRVVRNRLISRQAPVAATRTSGPVLARRLGYEADENRDC